MRPLDGYLIQCTCMCTAWTPSLRAMQSSTHLFLLVSACAACLVSWLLCMAVYLYFRIYNYCIDVYGCVLVLLLLLWWACMKLCYLLLSVYVLHTTITVLQPHCVVTVTCICPFQISGAHADFQPLLMLMNVVQSFTGSFSFLMLRVAGYTAGVTVLTSSVYTSRSPQLLMLAI